MPNKSLRCVLAAILLASSSSYAIAAEHSAREVAMWGPYATGFAVGGSIGTTGIGVDLGYAFNPVLSLRASVSGFGFEHNIERRDFDFKASLDLFDAGLYLDISPFPWRGFFFTVGALSHSFSIKGKARCTRVAGCKIDDETYNQSEIGTLSVAVKSTGLAPYLGVGLGSTMYHPGDAQRFFFRSDFGVVIPAKPHVTFAATGTVCDDSTADDGADGARAAQCRRSRAEARQDLEDGKEYFRFYPVIKFVFGWSF